MPHANGIPAWQRVLVGFDQWFNTWLGLVPRFRRAGFGHEDETVSSVLGKLTLQGSKPAKLFCRVLAKFDNNHCVDAIERSEGHRE